MTDIFYPLAQTVDILFKQGIYHPTYNPDPVDPFRQEGKAYDVLNGVRHELLLIGQTYAYYTENIRPLHLILTAETKGETLKETCSIASIVDSPALSFEYFTARPDRPRERAQEYFDHAGPQNDALAPFFRTFRDHFRRAQNASICRIRDAYTPEQLAEIAVRIMGLKA